MSPAFSTGSTVPPCIRVCSTITLSAVIEDGTTSFVRATDLEVDVGDEAPLRRRARDDLAEEPAVHGPVRVAGDDDVDLLVHPLDDRRQRARRVDTAVDRRLRVRAGPGGVPPRGMEPPSCRSTRIVSTPCRFSSGTSALTEPASSRKSTVLMPSGVTIVGVSSSVMPTIPTLTPLKWWIPYGAKIGCPSVLYLTFAARKSKVAPWYGSPSPHPYHRVAAVAAEPAAVRHAQQLVDALVELWLPTPL